jgi:hypothetical protein
MVIPLRSFKRAGQVQQVGVGEELSGPCHQSDLMNSGTGAANNGMQLSRNKQAANGKVHVAACAEHYLGYSVPLSGRALRPGFCAECCGDFSGREQQNSSGQQGIGRGQSASGPGSDHTAQGGFKIIGPAAFPESWGQESP